MRSRVLATGASCILALAVGCGSSSGDDDDDTTADAGLAEPDATPLPLCGDGVPEGTEECDDGNDVNTDDCTNDCTNAGCGDGITWNSGAGTEQCDDGNSVAEDNCTNDCTVPVCGDGVVWNLGVGTEECDDGNDVDEDDCLSSCVIATCGDGFVWNLGAGVEECDLGDSNSDYGRCGATCSWGSGLDGTFGDTWETLTGDGSLWALQSFHYTGAQFLHDNFTSRKYDIALDSWSDMTAVPFSNPIWSDAATAADALWVPRGSSMWKYDLGTELWSEVTTGIPDGSSQLTAAVFDGDGDIWYHGPVNDLIWYDVDTGLTLAFTHPDYGTQYETRVAYDPVTNSILFAGFTNGQYGIFDIEAETFSQGSVTPGTTFRDNTCQDRSGNVYSGSEDYTLMYQYNVEADAYAVLPDLPFDHDNNSTCVVSQDGYLYFASGSSFARLPLGTD